MIHPKMRRRLVLLATVVLLFLLVIGWQQLGSPRRPEQVFSNSRISQTGDSTGGFSNSSASIHEPDPDSALAPRPEGDLASIDYPDIALGSPRILVGILTVPAKFQRRMMIRSTYMRLKPEHTDVYFVMCSIDQENAGWYASMVHFEAINHRDIIILDSCTENMDMGKTYSYFEFVGRPHSPSVVGTLQLPAYDYVMKTDDDVFLHLPNLEARLAGIPRNLAYYGRQFSGFMTGMGYALSYDLVRWISQECEYCAENKVGQEDFMVAKWMIHSGKRIHWISEDSEHYDAPEFKQGWSHPYTSGTILIHRLKDDKWFMNAAARFVLPFI